MPTLGYVEWLKHRGIPLFEMGGVHWQRYRGTLVPASVGPLYVRVADHDAQSLMRTAGAWLMRYTTEPSETETAWWDIVCDSYDPSRFGASVRREVQQASRRCTVRRVEARWLAKNGYECYAAAFARYRGAAPSPRALVESNILATENGPQEWWGVFVGDVLAGYDQCIVEGGHVAANVAKFHPEYLKARTSAALMTHLANHYVVERGLCLSAGSRSISHDTNHQQYLMKFGFRQRFSRLQIIYRPWVGAAVRVLYPARRLIAPLERAPAIAQVRTLLHQEELRRSCAQ